MGCCAVIFWGLIALFFMSVLASTVGWPIAILAVGLGLAWGVQTLIRMNR